MKIDWLFRVKSDLNRFLNPKYKENFAKFKKTAKF
jgi:hypothetical protein